MRRFTVAAVAVAGVLPVGCGAGSGRSGTAASGLGLGRTIFVQECAGCHTLAGRERGAVGGDLVNAHLKRADVASFARVMPTPKPLSPTAAAAVAAYVDHVARSAGRGR